ncbi:MAG: RnfABCDGE type electron transport complex subunit D [Bacteroidaceae bacterium]|nr:RnfABCDGE type electron transport complex subunit D [Candidatus Colenecus caballi]MCQ2072052.1 RnfABCDGE type electron transport complex subunit D [Bacteroidaceae bacterium]
MAQKLYISTSPHVHGGDSIEKNMHWVITALLPAFIASVIIFGIGALIVTATSVLSCMLFEWLINRYLLKRSSSTLGDGSAIITGMLLAFNLPSNIPLYMVVMGSLVAIGIGKMAFGGLGNNPFNPALVGRVFLLVSFPSRMTSWPVPHQMLAYSDAVTAATPLGLMGYQNDSLPSYLDMFLGNTGGSLGETCALALLIGLVILLWRKVITWHIPVSILLTVAVLTGIMWLVNPVTYADPLTHLLSGGLMLGSIFMATDYVTSPMTKNGMVWYGIGIGFLTVIIRLFGSYPEGMSFAILIMNAVTPLINNWCKPKRFGLTEK